MNKTNSFDIKRIRLFLFLAFGIAWSVALIIWLNGGLANSPILIKGTGISLAVVLLATGYMYAPTIAHLLTRWITKEGWKNNWLPLNFRGRAWTWLAAWILPGILVLLGAVLYFAFFPRDFDPGLGTLQVLIAQSGAQNASLASLSVEVIALLQIVQALLLAPIINSLFTFGEEFGWRAYLQPKLMALGFRKAMLWMGLIWGLWHAPIIAMGHNYGLSYWGYPWTGILAMTWFTLTVGIVLGWLTLKGRSVWPAVIGHAALNGIAGVAVLFLSPTAAPNPLIGPLTVGLLANIPWLLLAAWIFWKNGELGPRNVSRETSAISALAALPKGSMIFAQGLSKSFGDVQAVADLDLDIPSGEVFGLLGPNGAGKTTTIRMLAALIAPSKGGAFVSGFRLGEENYELRKAVGILTEAPGLYQQLSAERNLSFYAQMYEVEELEKQVERYLRMLGLWERRKDAVGTFSKGMRQKLAIARALLHEPQVLFLDEPTSGLDPEAAKLVREFIEQLRGEGRTIVLTTHNLDEADRLCDRIAVFKTHLLALDSPTNLRRKLFGRSVVFHLANQNDQFLRALSQKDYVKDAKMVDNKIVLRLDEPEKRNPELVRELVGLGAEIQYIGELRQSLEDVYLQLIQGEEGGN